MGNVAKLVNIFILAAAIVVGLVLWLDRAPVLPESYLKDHYWGKKEWKEGQAIPADDVKLRKFTVNVPNDVLTDLKTRLSKSRLSTSIPGVGFNYGINSETLKTVVDYWSTKYDWRKQEKLINKYQNYLTQIEGIDIHFIHVKPPKTTSKLVVPLLLVHGWPGSVVEFLKIIPLLSSANPDVSFELVVPSLPGYGWSEPAQRPGMNVLATARIFAKLMTRLGHTHFFFHGGDWGSFVGKAISVMYPKRVVGLHTSMAVTKIGPINFAKLAIGEFLPSLVYDDPVIEQQLSHPLLDKLFFGLRETGYLHLQATKPDTIGSALNDSPAGLAAYILEKFSTWTDPAWINLPDGGLTKKFTMDELLTNVMVYWVTGTITSSQRYCKENLNYHIFSEVQLDRLEVTEDVPVAIQAGKNDLIGFPRTLLTQSYRNITQFNVLDAGHFTAFEVPQIVADDIRKFVLSLSSKIWWA